MSANLNILLFSMLRVSMNLRSSSILLPYLSGAAETSCRISLIESGRLVCLSAVTSKVRCFDRAYTSPLREMLAG